MNFVIELLWVGQHKVVLHVGVVTHTCEETTLMSYRNALLKKYAAIYLSNCLYR